MSQYSSHAVRNLRERLAALTPAEQADVASGRRTLEEIEGRWVIHYRADVPGPTHCGAEPEPGKSLTTTSHWPWVTCPRCRTGQCTKPCCQREGVHAEA